jgi:hypothetical protein
MKPAYSVSVPDPAVPWPASYEQLPAWQAGFGGVGSGQVVGVPQAPDALQVCVDVALAHCFDPGTHEPPHALPTHAYMQPLGVPHAPLALHVCTCVLLAHWVVPGEHTPPHVVPEQT